MPSTSRSQAGRLGPCWPQRLASQRRRVKCLKRPRRAARSRPEDFGLNSARMPRAPGRLERAVAQTGDEGWPERCPMAATGLVAVVLGVERKGRTVVWFELEAAFEPTWSLGEAGDRQARVLRRRAPSPGDIKRPRRQATRLGALWPPSDLNTKPKPTTTERLELVGWAAGTSRRRCMPVSRVIPCPTRAS